MTTEDKKRTLISYRMTQAKESLDEARYLLDGDKSLRSIANRIYYSMFYAVLALLVNEHIHRQNIQVCCHILIGVT